MIFLGAKTPVIGVLKALECGVGSRSVSGVWDLGVDALGHYSGAGSGDRQAVLLPVEDVLRYRGEDGDRRVERVSKGEKR
jgi:hypothetical protein